MILYYEPEGKANTVLDLCSTSEARVTRRMKPARATLSTLAGFHHLLHMTQQSSTTSRPQLLLYFYCTSLAPRMALRRFACSPAYPDAACVIEIGRTIKSKFRFHRRRPFLSGRVRHHRARRLTLERDQTKHGSQTPFPAYDLLSSLPTAPPSEPNRLCRGNTDERTPVRIESYTRRTSVSVLSSGSNNEWSKPALLVAIVDLRISDFRSLACSSS